MVVNFMLVFFFFFLLSGGGGGGGTEKQILNYPKLQQIGTWTILQRIMSTLRHSCCDGTRCGMTQSEGNQVQNHVNGTLHRMM